MPLRSIGVDVGGTKVLGVLTTSDGDGEVLAEERVPTPSTGEAILDAERYAGKRIV